VLGKISFIKRTQQETLILIIMFVSIFLNFWSEILSLPSVIKYVCDICWIFLFVFILISKRKKYLSKPIKIIGMLICAFYIYAILNYIVNYQSIFYFLWGTRNLFRFYVFFFACALYLDEKNINLVRKILDVIFYINIGMIALQYFVFKISGDYLGGFFGIESGCNGYLNIYFVISTIIYLVRYNYKKIAFWKVLIRLALMLMSCALSELKIFYIEFVIILVLFSLITKFSIKKVVLFLLCIIGIIVGVKILTQLYPYFSDFFSIEKILEIASSDKGYTNANDFNRLNSITMTNNYFFDTTPQKLFGFGLGNCDYADGKDFLTSVFYTKYEYLHYFWISYAIVYLELGYIGLAFYYTIFLLIIIFLFKNLKDRNYNIMYVRISFITSVLMILISIYNSSLRNESAYLLFFVLSVGFVPQKSKSLVKEKNFDELYNKSYKKTSL